MVASSETGCCTEASSVARYPLLPDATRVDGGADPSENADRDAMPSLGPEARPVTPLSIIAAELRALSALAAESVSVEATFADRLDRITRLAAGLDRYLEACTTPESEALAELAKRTRVEPWGDRFADGQTGVALEQEMLSGHVEGQFLKTLVHATGARRILEIGLFTGYSALAMAECLPADGQLIALELDGYAAAFARRSFAGQHAAKISIEVGPAIASLRRLVEHGRPFDLIFLDADKAGYAGYLDVILAGGLLAPRGLICVDNTLMQGQPYDGSEPTANGRAIAAFNVSVAQDPRVEQVMLPLRDGLTLIRHA